MIKNEQRAQGNDFGAGAKGFERGNAVRLSLAAAKLDYKSQSIRRLPVTGYLTSHPKSDFPEICDLIGPLVKCYPTWHLSKNSKKKLSYRTKALSWILRDDEVENLKADLTHPNQW